MAEPEQVQAVVAVVGALAAGFAGNMGVQRFRMRNGSGRTGLADVVAAIKDEGDATRKVIYETSEKQAEKIGDLAVSVARLEGKVG